MREVSRELEKMGHEVVVISREDDLGIKSLAGSFGPLRRAVKKINADIVNAHDWSIALPLVGIRNLVCLLYTSPSPRDRTRSRMPSSA